MLLLSLDYKVCGFSFAILFHSGDILSDNEVISIALAYIHLHVIMGACCQPFSHIHIHIVLHRIC